MPMPPLVEPVDALSPAERARTARHTSLARLGEIGQRRLAAAHVAVVGAGGLGSPVIFGLAAAGVGTLTVIDDDVVEASNLQRQVLHRLEDVGMSKADSAVRVAADLSPETVVHVRRARLNPDNARELLDGADIVIDGTDTFETREAVAAATEARGVPLVWGTVQEFDAQVTVFWSAPPAGHAPVLLRDLYPSGSVGEVPTCADVGVLGTVCLQVGALMATQAITLLTGIGEPLLGRVLVIDALSARQWEVPLRGSAVSSTRTVAAPSSEIESDAAPSAPPVPTISVEELRERLAAGTDTVVIDVREDAEVADGMIAGARHVPLRALLADPAGVLDGAGTPDRTDAPVVLVCRMGPRAERASRALHAAGIDSAVLGGGMLAWTDAYGPSDLRAGAEIRV
ncbi:ThiF family adenylyltransferase [Microbacterium sp. P02]|uniref:ThiF family adenylyltransferase n=1 Tax=Microbacterium sp. P02 TaxID=3366260 RepID=UPI0036726CFC